MSTPWIPVSSPPVNICEVCQSLVQPEKQPEATYDVVVWGRSWVALTLSLHLKKAFPDLRLLCLERAALFDAALPDEDLLVMSDSMKSYLAVLCRADGNPARLPFALETLRQQCFGEGITGYNEVLVTQIALQADAPHTLMLEGQGAASSLTCHWLIDLNAYERSISHSQHWIEMRNESTCQIGFSERLISNNRWVIGQFEAAAKQGLSNKATTVLSAMPEVLHV